MKLVYFKYQMEIISFFYQMKCEKMLKCLQREQLSKDV